MRILHLPVNPSNQAKILVKGLKNMNCKADILIFTGNFFYKEQKGILNRYPGIIKNFMILPYFLKSLVKYDIFHFHFGHSFFSKNRDLNLIKKFKKKIIMHFWGDDIRIYSLAKKNNLFLNYLDIYNKENKKIRKLIKISKYTDIAIVADLELYSYIKDFFKKIVFLPQVIDTAQYEVFYPSVFKKKLVILHAPSYRKIKGTEWILKSIDLLKKKFEIEFRIVEKLSNQKLLELLRDTDIVVDQIILGTYGFFSLEAMAMGKPVICYINENYRKSYPLDLPIVSADINNLSNKLEELIKDGNMRNQLGIKGRKYVERYHDIKVVSRKLLSIYKEL